MTIRQAGTGDLDQLTVLFDQYRIFYRMDPDIDGARSFLYQRLTMNDSVIYISVQEDGQIAGFVQLYPLFSSTQMKRMWLLNDLYVLPAFRRRGISVQLIDEAKNLCVRTGACSLILETARSNDIGNRLYPETGFSIDTDHNYYYWNNG
jgi:ribosomal protein S18 acetylase RimI-like enzyme